VLQEFSASAVTTEVLEYLERRRPAIVHDEAIVRAEVQSALEPIRREYAGSGLPQRYLEALEQEILASVPARWRGIAEPFTRLEKAGYGVWRGGDVIARAAYALAGLAIGGLVIWAPFIPIWDKWFAFVLGGAAWWLPDLQSRWARRRYARRLGEIVAEVGTAQKALDRQLTVDELFPTGPTRREPR
jgi:hypothetical protein